MTTTSPQETPQFSPHAGRVKTGVTMVVIGAFLGALGSILAGVEFAVATRRWLNEQGHPPTELARIRLRQAVSASQAASQAAHDAWQKLGDGASVLSGSMQSGGSEQ